MSRLESERNVPVHQQLLTDKPSGGSQLDPTVPLAKYGIRTNGDFVYLTIDATAAVLVAGPTMVTVTMAPIPFPSAI